MAADDPLDVHEAVGIEPTAHDRGGQCANRLAKLWLALTRLAMLAYRDG
jgi:hypothetical protein